MFQHHHEHLSEPFELAGGPYMRICRECGSRVESRRSDVARSHVEKRHLLKWRRELDVAKSLGASAHATGDAVAAEEHASEVRRLENRLSSLGHGNWYHLLRWVPRTKPLRRKRQDPQGVEDLPQQDEKADSPPRSHQEEEEAPDSAGGGGERCLVPGCQWHGARSVFARHFAAAHGAQVEAPGRASVTWEKDGTWIFPARVLVERQASLAPRVFALCQATDRTFSVSFFSTASASAHGEDQVVRWYAKIGTGDADLCMGHMGAAKSLAVASECWQPQRPLSFFLGDLIYNGYVTHTEGFYRTTVAAFLATTA